jgi:glycosyltransferase involved in cell wall biosynthesis/putative flippase GtrA
MKKRRKHKVNQARQQSAQPILNAHVQGKSESNVGCIKLLVRFIGVGMLNTLVGYAIYGLFVYLNIPYLIALLMATMIGVIFNYFSMGRLVFKSQGGWFVFAKFIITYAIVFGVNAKALELLITKFEFSPYLGQALCVPLSVIVSWLLMNYWVYKMNKTIIQPQMNNKTAVMTETHLTNETVLLNKIQPVNIVQSDKLISIVTPCYNEEDNIEELYDRIVTVMATLPYNYEHICIDNCSTDGTVAKIKKIAEHDNRLKLIVNARNFGWIRSPHHGILQSRGEACVLITSDLQDPPEIIPEFIKKWEQGYKIVLAVKPQSNESGIMFALRKAYYHLVTTISEVPLVENATGAGLYDRIVIEILRDIGDPYPYFRGLLCEIGFPIATVPFKQPRRQRGVSQSNFYALYDVAMLGITKHSKVPLRLMAMGGFILSFISLLVAISFFVAKLVFWDSFQLGAAPMLIGIFFFGAIQSFFIGVLGEYVGSIQTQVRNMPLVVEIERVNFE